MARVAAGARPSAIQGLGVDADLLIAPVSAHEAGTVDTDETDTVLNSSRQYIRVEPVTSSNNYGVGPFDMADTGVLSVHAYGSEGITTDNITWWLTNDDNGLAQPRCNLTVGGAVTGSMLDQEWRDIILHVSDFNLDGAMDFSNIQGMRLQKSITGDYIILGGVQVNWRCRPVIVVMLDDGDQTQYDNRAEFIDRGIPVSWAVNRNAIDTGAVTTANIATALSEGFGELVLHGDTDLTTYNPVDLDAELAAQIAWVEDRDGVPTAMALPSGGSNSAVKAALTARGVTVARGLGGAGYTYQAYHRGFAEPLNLTSQALTSVTAGTLVADVKAAVDDAFKRMASLILNIHTIAPSGGSNYTTIADLRLVLEHIVKRRNEGRADTATLTGLETLTNQRVAAG